MLATQKYQIKGWLRIRNLEPALWSEDSEQKIIVFPEHYHQLSLTDAQTNEFKVVAINYFPFEKKKNTGEYETRK